MSDPTDNTQDALSALGVQSVPKLPIVPTPAVPTRPEQISTLQGQIADTDKQIAGRTAAKQTEESSIGAQREQDFATLKKDMGAGPPTAKMPDMPVPKPQELTASFGALMVLAMLSGRGQTRNHAMGAMAAMTGMMNGAAAGNKEEYDRQMKTYEAAFKRATETEKEKVSEYNRIIANDKLSLDQREIELRNVALKYQDIAALEKISAHQTQEFYHLVDAQQKAVDHAEDRDTLTAYQEKALKAGKEKGLTGKIDDIEEALTAGKITPEEATQARDKVLGGAGEGLGKESLETAGWEFLMFGKLPPGMGNASAAQRKQVYAERARLAEQMKLSPQEVAMLPQDNHVKMKAVGNLTNWGAMVGKSQEQLDMSLNLAIQYAEKLDQSRIKALNKMVIAGELQVNDPTENGYVTAMSTVRREYGRLMSGPTSNAMLPVEAMKQADHLLENSLDVPALKETASVMKKDAGYTLQSVQDQIAGLRASMAPGAQGEAPAGAQESKTIGGKTYHKINGQWME